MSISIIGDKCCGCRACLTACKFGAIADSIDKYGFEYPKIDNTKCINCRACEKVCPMINEVSTGRPFSCGAAYALNDEIKKNCSSGGLFGVFAEHVIENGGIVYGAAFDKNLKLKTTAALTKEELFPLYKSKYLLCDTDNKFIEIKERLDDGKYVLYASSPCQIAALKLFLKKEYDNLITVDFVCHGVGSKTMFDKSLKYTERKLSSSINNFVFRVKGKKNNASSYYYSFNYKKGEKNYTKTELYMFFPYYYAYHLRIAYREECYKCKYAKENRVSDITIGDFHTIGKYNKSIDRFAGISMFVCNTEKGQSFLESVKNRLYIESYEWDILKQNNRFGGVETPPSQRSSFLESFSERSFEYVVKHYLNPYKNWRLIYYKTPAIIRNFVRRILEK